MKRTVTEMSNDMNHQIDFLYETLSKVKSKQQFKDLFDDLCTYKEIEAMAQRIQSAKLLIEGETYEKIIETTGISSATLSRVNKCVKYGKGYKSVLNK